MILRDLWSSTFHELMHPKTSHIDNSTRISFSKMPALTLSCLGLCTQNTLFKKCGHNPSLKLLLLLLLSGDVSLNPGPNISCNMRFATTNLRSVRQKSAALSDLISSKQIDILAMTETWLSSRQHVLPIFLLQGFHYFIVPACLVGAVEWLS